MPDPKTTLEQLYCAGSFGAETRELLPLLESVLSTEPRPTFSWKDPEALLAIVHELAENPGTPVHLAQEFIEHTRRLHSPRYMGHQVPPPLPVGSLFDFIACTANQGGSVYEMSPFSSAAERYVVKRLGAAIGWPAGEWDGVMTHGGSLANTTALLTARNVRFGESWESGIDPSCKPLILVSQEAHYSIARSAGILGLGTSNVRKVPVDEERRLSIAALTRMLDEAQGRGEHPFCLVGSACTTPTGAFDPLREMGELARERGLWFHVDGAHAAGVVLSERYGHLAEGIELADSVVWDAHKMLYMPVISTLLLYRNRENSFQTFKQDAPYLFSKQRTEHCFDAALRTLECTKRSLALPLFAGLALYGEKTFAMLLENAFDRTREFFHLLESEEDFRPMHFPQANILCFQHVPATLRDEGPAAIAAFQDSVRQRLLEEGDFYITRTQLDGSSVLRTTLMNPFIETRHLKELLERLRAIGKDILFGSPLSQEGAVRPSRATSLDA